MTLLAVAAPPVVPAAGYAVAALGSLIAFVVCWGLLHTWKATLGRFLLWLAGVGIRINRWGIHVALEPFHAAAGISTDVEKWLSQGMSATEAAMVRWFSASYALVSWIVTAPFKLGEATYTALHNLAYRVTHTVPRVIRETVVKPVTKVITKTVTNTVVRVGHLDKAIRAAERRIAHAAAVAVHSIAVTIPRVGHLERTGINVRNLPKWLKKHLVAILAGGVLLTALRRLRLGWLRCTNVNKFNKRLCTASPGWLDEFLLGMTVIVGATSFVEFVEEAQAGEELALDLLSGFVRELKGLDLDRARAAAAGFATLVE